MHVEQLTIFGYKCFTNFAIGFDDGMNIVAGDNEEGKSTLLEAIAIALTCQIDGRNIAFELNPYFFNTSLVATYFSETRSGKAVPPPHILIEAYLSDDGSAEAASLKGTNNSTQRDCPGMSVSIRVNDDHSEEFRSYISQQPATELVPVEFYSVEWRSFAFASMTSRRIPLRTRLIDSSRTRAYANPHRYVTQLVTDVLEEERVALAIAYRGLKGTFMNDASMIRANKRIAEAAVALSEKPWTVSLDMSARSTWEQNISPHLDDIPFGGIGKGEQCRIQAKLAIASSPKNCVLLVEEPENHLSYPRMRQLLDDLAGQSGDRQLIISTHSTYVLNKLGVDRLRLLSNGSTLSLAELDSDTRDFFMKLPGYDTLRLVLAKKAILVEGPSDELVVQRAYRDAHNCLPIEQGVDVISVGNTFKRFLAIAALLKRQVIVLTDNDGDITALKSKYSEYLNGQHPTVRVLFDTDEMAETLEPQLLKANSRQLLNRVLGTAYDTDATLLAYMRKHKTDAALKIFESAEAMTFPKYIRDAIC